MKRKFLKLDEVGADGTPGSAAPAAPAGDAQTDTLSVNAGSMSAGGSVAARLLQSGFKVEALRTNDVLRKDEWIQYDEAVVEVARANLVLVGDLMARGLTYNLANALGVTSLQWEQVTDMTDAEVTMSGLAESERDRVTFNLLSLPIPLTHKDFTVNIRTLEASRRNGESLDTTQARVATRKVAERIEKTFVDGFALPFGGGNIYGLTNHPNRNTGSLTSNWADSVNTTGEEIVGDVMNMLEAAVGDNFYGPYELVVPNDYFVRLADDYKANSDRTIMERILAIPGISAVKPSAYLAGGASGEVVLFQLSTDVVDVVDGIQPTPVTWDTNGGFVMHYKVMAIVVPRVKADAEGKSGVVHFSV